MSKRHVHIGKMFVDLGVHLVDASHLLAFIDSAHDAARPRLLKSASKLPPPASLAVQHLAEDSESQSEIGPHHPLQDC